MDSGSELGLPSDGRFGTSASPKIADLQSSARLNDIFFTDLATYKSCREQYYVKT